ncbi:trypco2 family protein [Streptomyces sp. MBT62]|uniref:trypco2 family protein n=1 Tax=Streptomyces sp. MBT62 TaxID=2800410 RepID=UPI00190C2477|nr:trypco2 family protein [Streptomyces sp. MBT62]MBK3563709.1 hypothetical protein [Streptomyces sp. MBT62]
MAEQEDSGEGLGLAEAIAAIRDDLLRAQASAVGAAVQLPIESLTVALRVTATRTRDGRAGFKVPFGAEVGGGLSRGSGTEQVVTVVFGEPVDCDGRPVKVAALGNELKD